MCTGLMNHRGSYAPMGRIERSKGPKRCAMERHSGWSAVSPAKNTAVLPVLIVQPHQRVALRFHGYRPEKCCAGVHPKVADPTLTVSHQSSSLTVLAPR